MPAPSPGSGTTSAVSGTELSGTGGSPSVQQPASSSVSEVTSAPVGSIPLGPNTGLDLRRRETIYVSLIWGVQPEEKRSKIWRVEGNKIQSQGKEDNLPLSLFDLKEPAVQVALYETVQMARTDENLSVQPDKPTWIEKLHDFALEIGLGFHIVSELFVGYVQLLKELDEEFAGLVADGISTQSPGLAGDFTFVSVTLQADAMTDDSFSLNESVYRKWSAFAQEANSRSPSIVPEMVAQSRIFLDAYRVEATIESTVAMVHCQWTMLAGDRSLYTKHRIFIHGHGYHYIDFFLPWRNHFFNV